MMILARPKTTCSWLSYFLSFSDVLFFPLETTKRTTSIPFVHAHLVSDFLIYLLAL